MKICVVGLGYVGLPLAVRFGQLGEVNAYDVDRERLTGLQKGFDRNGEFTSEELARAKITYNYCPEIVSECDFIIIAVPTPVDEAKNPNLLPLLAATHSVGRRLKRDSVVVYESTVYPGCTEKECIPALQHYSGLKCGDGFSVGYSPERINPGDPEHRLESIVKVVAGSDQKTANIVASVYRRIIKAGVYVAPSIKVAEAAKVIENTQRDINIALMNELKMIFDKSGLDWREVLEAAKTKWNFMEFTPGLVGGHCIGVDPYYLAYEAQRVGHHPEMILAGRRINDAMVKYEAVRIVKAMGSRGVMVEGVNVLILGATFKPNIADTRNSKVADLVAELESYGCDVAVCDPHVSARVIFGICNVSIYRDFEKYDFVVKAVDHDEFKNLPADYVVCFSRFPKNP
jgi:UDP-N-acetyl-D-galactosamine dehydrogenase